MDAQNRIKSEKKRMIRSNSTTPAHGVMDQPQTHYLHLHSTIVPRPPLEKPPTSQKNEPYAKNNSRATSYKGYLKNQIEPDSTITKANKSITMPQLNSVNMTAKKNNIESNIGHRRRCMIHSNSLDGKLITKGDGHYEMNGVLSNDHKNENNLKNHFLSNIQQRPKPVTNYNSVTAKYLHPNDVIDKKQTNATQEDVFETNSRLKALENKIRSHKADMLKFLKGHTKQKTLGKNTSKSRPECGMFVPNGKEKLKNNYLKNPADIAENIKKIDYAYPKLNVDNLRHSKQNHKWLKPSLNNYGVISATDLSKLRAISTEEY